MTATTSSPQPFSFFAQTFSIAPSQAAPATAPPRVASLSLSPASVASGSSTVATVALDSPAPAGGAVVQLSNSIDFFGLDADFAPVVLVPPGATSASFTVSSHLASPTATLVQEAIVASYFGGPFQGAYLTIHAAVP